MNDARRRSLRLAPLALLIAGAMAGCSPATDTSSPTPSPSPTVDAAVAQALAAADHSYEAGDVTSAISQYGAILQKSVDPTLRAQVLKGLGNIGYADMQASRSLGPDHCQQTEEAEAAFHFVLNAYDRPAFTPGDSFILYTTSARVEHDFAECRLYHDTPPASFTELIRHQLGDMDRYPDDPAVTDILVPTILETFERELGEFATNAQAVFSNARAIVARVGGYKVYYKTVADTVNAELLKTDLCSGGKALTEGAGTSTTKGFYYCSHVLRAGSQDAGDQTSGAISQSGLSAADPSEAWYVVDYEVVSKPEIKCHGTNDGTPFEWTYPGQWTDKYSLRDVHTGKVVASKTFQSTAPRCVFIECIFQSLPVSSISCRGGEGKSAYDQAKLVTWLKANVK